MISNIVELINIFSSYEFKFILIFHNDPNTLRGSRSIKEKINILQNCDKIIFVSSYVKERFFYNINERLPSKGQIIRPSTNYYNHNFKKNIRKEKIIVFIGKLNASKGYNFFGPAVINILNKYKDNIKFECVEKLTLMNNVILFVERL